MERLLKDFQEKTCNAEYSTISFLFRNLNGKSLFAAWENFLAGGLPFYGQG